MVGELMNDDVVSVIRLAAFAERGIPREQHRSAVYRLPGEGGIGEEVIFPVVRSHWRAELGGKHHDVAHEGVITSIRTTARSNAVLSSDSHLHLFGDEYAAAAEPLFLRNQDLCDFA